MFVQERAQTVCEKTLPCGHHCCGVKDEADCLPCLHGCSPPDGVDKDRWSKLKQDADDMCMVCYTEGLSCAPSVQVRIVIPCDVGIVGNNAGYFFFKEMLVINPDLQRSEFYFLY